MLRKLFYKKAHALLYRFSGRLYVTLTDKFTCKEFRDDLDLSKSEFERIVQALDDSGYVEIKHQGGCLVLTVNEQGKSVVAGRDPFKIKGKGAAK
jgi:CTP-dependent riboflavin kinase